MRLMLVILLSFFLVACATTNTTQLQQGRADFAAQRYHKAFNTLMPLAKKGNAEAEYAVGYFYYYGKGVREDEKKAQYWINRSAQQGYAPAIRALEIEASRKS